MKLSINKNQITLANQNNVSVKFASPEEAFTNTVNAYYKRLGVDELDFRLQTFSSSESVLTFSTTGHQILITPIMAFELANRMILLNDKLKLPEIVVVEADEE